MRYPILLALLLLAHSAVMAGVYKSIGPDGRIQYTDRPISGAQEVPIPQTAPPSQAEESERRPAASIADAGPYEAFEIASPETNATFRNEKGTVSVSLILAPAILAEHKIRLLVDDQPVPGDIPGTQLALNDMTVGTHRLQAQILDEFDVPIAYTEIVTVHMRKPIPENSLP